jgi:hypothetical protein
MVARILAVVTLAAAVMAPACAEHNFTPSETSVLSGAIVLASPFILSYYGGKKLSEAGSGELQSQKRWRVAAVRPQGEKTALELRSEDQTLMLETTVATRTARAQGLKAGDQLGIEAIGKSGYAVKKADTTIGVLVQPESGLVHSKARA